MKRTAIQFFALLSLVFCSNPLWGQSGSSYSSSELILRFEPGTSLSQQQQILNQYNLDVIGGPTPVTKFLLCQIAAGNFPTLPPGSYQNVPDSISGVIVTIENLEADVDGIGLQYDVFPPFSIDSTIPETAAPFSPLDGCALQELPNIFTIDIPMMGNNIYKTGVFDTGIAGTVSSGDFHLAHNALFSPHLNANNPGFNLVVPTNFPVDEHGHGTHMASILVEDATGQGNSGIYPVNLEIYKTHDNGGSGKMFDIIEGVDVSILRNVKIVNCSFTYYAPGEDRFRLSNPLRIAMKEARQTNGTLFIAAAGNHGINNDGVGLVAFPASFPIPNLISVASVGCTGELSSFSNFGMTSVDLAAPGERIIGAYTFGSYAELSGTSPATAMVSRVAAMLASHQPTFDFTEIICAILNGTKDHLSLTGKVRSGGMLDAAKAYDQFMYNSNCGTGGGGNPPSNDANRRQRGEASGSLGLEIQTAHANSGIGLKIMSPREQAAEVALYNILGQRLFLDKVTLASGENSYWMEQASGEQPGIYLIEVRTSDQRQVLQLMR